MSNFITNKYIYLEIMEKYKKRVVVYMVLFWRSKCKSPEKLEFKKKMFVILFEQTIKNKKSPRDPTA